MRPARGRTRAGPALAALSLTCGLGRAAIAAPCPARLERPPCAPEWIDLDALERLLCVELGSTTSTASPSVVAVGASACRAGTTLLALAITTPAAPMEELDVLLGDVPQEVRPRTAALAIREAMLHLVAPAGAHPRDTGARTPPAVEAAAREPTPSSVPGKGLSIAPWASGASTWLVRYSTTTLGLHAGVELATEELRWLSLRFDAAFAVASRQHRLGFVDLTYASVGGAVLWVRPAGALQVALGPRAELSFASVRGTATAPATRAGTAAGETVGLMLDVIASLPVASEVAVFCEVTAGGYLRGLDTHASEDPVLGVSGWSLSLAFGATLWPR